MAKHSKRYRWFGRGVELWCGSEIIASNPYRGTNFDVTNCRHCGMDVRTYGHSPATDYAEEFGRNN